MRVEILDGKECTFQHREAISRLGFWFIKSQQVDGKWTKECNKEDLQRIRKFCKRRKLEYAVYEEGYIRSSNYRYKYFKAHKGLFNTFYQCAYCGKIRTKKHITVDHIIPVDKVIKGKKREKYKKILKRKNITDINDIRNLVPACKRCNSKKSANTGFWIIRGEIGRHPIFWIIYYLIIIILTMFIICNFHEIVDFLKQLFIQWIN
jgi:5-methylcytosine-specific restriction endonuclease McrA